MIWLYQKVLKESLVVQKQTLQCLKSLNLSFLIPERQRRGMELQHSIIVKSNVCYIEMDTHLLLYIVAKVYPF